MRKYFFTAAIAAVLMSLALAAVVGASQQHGGDIIYTKPLNAVIFSHKAHVEKTGLTCDMCHPGVFEMKALKVQEAPDYTMASLDAGKYCGVCHNGTMAFSSTTRCATCHIGVKGLKGNGKPAGGH